MRRTDHPAGLGPGRPPTFWLTPTEHGCRRLHAVRRTGSQFETWETERAKDLAVLLTRFNTKRET
ncbi:hypothetical protein ACIRQH_38065 [Streptomyces sp. NPDC102279]|uniref:hypothetical protein n=1 Tax=Streptomyces sp. NPDC102279 TaxID=3366153 RepID=UPI003807E2CD